MGNFNKTPAEHIAAHNDGLDTLKRLMDIVDDRSSLTEAHEAARAAMQLTEDQKLQYETAIDFIAQHEKLSAELDQKTSDLRNDQQLHAESVESFSAWRTEEILRLKTLEDDLATSIRTVDARAKKLEEEWIDLQLKFSEAMTPIDDHYAQIEKDRNRLSTEEARLNRLREKLEAKAKKTAEILADDGEDVAA